MLQIFCTHQSKCGTLEDYCDGTQYLEHLVFSSDRTGLQIMLYYDDVEVSLNDNKQVGL